MIRGRFSFSLYTGNMTEYTKLFDVIIVNLALEIIKLYSLSIKTFQPQIDAASWKNE